MGQRVPAEGWKISQVVSLLNMERRDITRSCYADRRRGGAGILQPADGSWGRRSYSVEDIGWLYLVKLQHEAGFSLPEIATRMDTSVGVEGLCDLLRAVEDRAAEEFDELQAKRERARVLRYALEGSARRAQESLEQYLNDRLGAETVGMLRFLIARPMAPDVDGAPQFQFGVQDCMRLRQVLDEPGMDLAIDLWAGPGSYERLVEAAVGWTGA
uniref:MerR family transcriptional regulator n=1 Tax=Collinsella sp. BA40 TaxID=2560852 RepID=UPI00164F5856|nr:MerR family transcriptional regulator [Collinsella sp. BA40]